eukprot:TRINITY_DN12771_c0_g1_i7.p1 TRINITY_DN12771_c0_g1~~TRINITY_DN12771_c0_g1_i7.p1  ORF type:complete len:235 (+),score=35.80 TRINITY_DN12771_c0_g1_i7:168-872(+)
MQRGLVGSEMCIRDRYMGNGGSKNMIPRLGGQFLRDQFTFAHSIEPTYTQVYIAMFDEFDEGTAIAKGAEDSSMIPNDQYFLTWDADGKKLPSDHYLKLAGELTNTYHHSVVPKCDLHHGPVLNQNENLVTHCRLNSNNKHFHLLIKSNGQIGLYGHSSEMWHSPNSPSTHSPFKLEMQSDGNLVLYSGGSKIIWASNSAGKGTAPYHLELQDDGNLVIYDKSHKAVWAIHQNI